MVASNCLSSMNHSYTDSNYSRLNETQAIPKHEEAPATTVEREPERRNYAVCCFQVSSVYRIYHLCIEYVVIMYRSWRLNESYGAILPHKRSFINIHYKLSTAAQTNLQTSEPSWSLSFHFLEKYFDI